MKQAAKKTLKNKHPFFSFLEVKTQKSVENGGGRYIFKYVPPYVSTQGDEAMLKQTIQDISFLLSFQEASLATKKITIEEKYGKYTSLRTVPHVILRAPVGQAKSTVLQQLSKDLNVPVLTEATRAGLVGAIDNKTMQPIPGAAWTSRNSFLLMDEFKFGKKDGGWEVFLQLLEDQRWAKRIGVYSPDINEEDHDLYFKTQKGSIELKTRFAAVIGTMKRFELQTGQAFRAFVSRCIPYEFQLNREELKEIAEGKKLYQKKTFPKKEEITISHKEYKKIIENVDKTLNGQCKNPKLGNELFLRSIGDCCRYYAATGQNNTKAYKLITTWKAQTYNKLGTAYKGETE